MQSWDTANKPTELADYSVGTTWGIIGNQYYLLSIYRSKIDFPELKQAVKRECARWRATVVLIEDKASGTQLIQDLRNEQMHVHAIKPDADKVMRMHSQTAVIESGVVHIPDRASWLAEFIHEVAVFPNGRYDDQVDSMSQFLIWASQALGANQFRVRRL